MNAFILFVFLRAVGANYTLETAEFANEQSCQVAVEQVKRSAGLNVVNVYCLPKGN